MTSDHLKVNVQHLIDYKKLPIKDKCEVLIAVTTAYAWILTQTPVEYRESGSAEQSKIIIENTKYPKITSACLQAQLKGVDWK